MIEPERDARQLVATGRSQLLLRQIPKSTKRRRCWPEAKGTSGQTSGGRPENGPTQSLPALATLRSAPAEEQDATTKTQTVGGKRATGASNDDSEASHTRFAPLVAVPESNWATRRRSPKKSRGLGKSGDDAQRVHLGQRSTSGLSGGRSCAQSLRNSRARQCWSGKSVVPVGCNRGRSREFSHAAVFRRSLPPTIDRGHGRCCGSCVGCFPATFLFACCSAI
jgi:hypothetical protein